MTEIGKRIAEARTVLGMTKQGLARRVGFSWRVVHEWETGMAEPAAMCIAPLAEALGVSVGWLLGEPTAELTAMAQEDGLYDEPPSAAETQRRVVDASRAIERGRRIAPPNVVRLSDRRKK